MLPFQKDIQAYNNTYNTAYNSKLCFDDLLKISQRDFNTQQSFNSQQPFNTQLFNTQFNSQQLNVQQQYNTPQLNTQLNNFDVSCANCMSSLFNLSPFESLPTTNIPTTNISTTNIPTTNMKFYDEIDMNIEEIPIPQIVSQTKTQNTLEQKVAEQKVVEQKPLEENRLQQKTSSQQNPIQQIGFTNTTHTTSQNDVQLWFPQQNSHNYKSVISFVDRVLEHFNALSNLNKMTPKHRYKREYVFNIWKQTIFCAKQGLIPLPYPLLHKSYIKDQNQNTIAMILASQKIYVPKHWMHKPTLTNKFGETVAIIYAKHGIIPPQEWKHAFNLVCPENGQTVFMSLVQNYCRQQCSKQEYSKQGYSKQQQSQQQSKFEQWLQNIPSYWIHSDEIMDQYGQTVSSILSSNGLKVK